MVLWGAARADVPSDANVDGVRFLDGRGLLEWLSELDGHEVSRDAAKDVLRLLTDYRATVATASK